MYAGMCPYFSLVTFSACSSDDDNNNPVTEPVFLSKIDMVTFTPLTGDTLAYSKHNNYWEGGLLKKQHTVEIVRNTGEESLIELPVLLLRLLYLS